MSVSASGRTRARNEIAELASRVRGSPSPSARARAPSRRRRARRLRLATYILGSFSARAAHGLRMSSADDHDGIRRRRADAGDGVLAGRRKYARAPGRRVAATGEEAAWIVQADGGELAGRDSGRSATAEVSASAPCEAAWNLSRRRSTMLLLLRRGLTISSPVGCSKTTALANRPMYRRAMPAMR